MQFVRVLVACEFSNTVRDAFLRRGHDAWSCDLERAVHPNPNALRHIQADVRPILKEKWDLVIAHPPCTYLSFAGVQWVKKRHNGMELVCKAAEFFLECLCANSPRVCVENPLMHHYAKKFIPWKPTQIIQPWQFGHSVCKSTCLWLVGLPPLTPTKIVYQGEKDHKGTSIWHRNPAYRRPPWEPRLTRQQARSKTFEGIAEAMAAQWGGS